MAVFQIISRGLIRCGLLLASVACLAGDDLSEPAAPAAAPLSGTLSSAGSDTLHNMMMIWRRHFVARHPQLNLQIQSSGSATAAVALSEGTASLGPMSRLMIPAELARFERRFGYLPTAVPVALDMLAIYVHQDNPLNSISMAQLEGIYAQNGWCAATPPILNWQQLGLSGVWQQRPVVAYGRNQASGTYTFFRQQVLCDGDFRSQVQQLPGAAAVVRAVSQSINAIGYSGVGQQIAGVRWLAVRPTAEDAAVLPLAEHAASGAYPLARMLYIYLNKAPDKALPAAEREFLRFVLSTEGQALLATEGMVPVPPSVLASIRQELEL